MMNEEGKIIQRAQKGDALAFARLQETYYPDIYRFFYYRIMDAKNAEDLASALFISMIERIGFYKLESVPFLSWLYSLARTVLMEELLRRGWSYDQAPQKQVYWSPDDLPSDRDNPQANTYILKRALARLSTDEREVVIGKLVENRTNRAIGREIGRTASTVKQIQHQALIKLRSALREERYLES